MKEICRLQRTLDRGHVKIGLWLRKLRENGEGVEEKIVAKKEVVVDEIGSLRWRG